MKIIKTILTTLLIVALLLVGVFLAGRYGWKVFGFNACQGAWFEEIDVQKDFVRIKGGYPGSFPSGCCGYYSKEEDGKLYVGIRFSAIFGFFETGNFEFTIPVKGEIQEVILKTRNNEFSIWMPGQPDDQPQEQPAEDAIPAAYGVVLGKYTAALFDQCEKAVMVEQGLNYMAADLGAEQVGYAIRDLDGNGVPELVIASSTADEFYGKMVLDVYTLDGTGELVQIINGTERNRYYYAGENRFANLGSSSWSDSIETTVKLEDGELIDMTFTTVPEDYEQLPLTLFGQG